MLFRSLGSAASGSLNWAGAVDIGGRSEVVRDHQSQSAAALFSPISDGEIDHLRLRWKPRLGPSILPGEPPGHHRRVWLMVVVRVQGPPNVPSLDQTVINALGTPERKSRNVTVAAEPTTGTVRVLTASERRRRHFAISGMKELCATVLRVYPSLLSHLHPSTDKLAYRGIGHP